MIVPGSMTDWVQATVLAGALVGGAFFLGRSLVDEAAEIEVAVDEQVERPDLVDADAA